VKRRRYLQLLSGLAFSQTARADDTPKPVAEFLEKFDVPGLSFAIAKNGVMMRTEAYGFANPKNKEVLHAGHRFRIASISKPITSTAIFLLIERGQLKLDDAVFGKEGILGFAKAPEGITVRHLLTHTSGGWKNDDHDPMFRQPELDHTELIKWTIENQSLVNPPGTNYAYSNFGYCLLGRIIEKISDQSYETFVRASVLKSCDADAMQIGGNTKAERLKLEVNYYDAGGKETTYPMNVRRMDSHGGWVGTPEQLVDFALRVDDFPEPTDILKKESIHTMTERYGVNPDYACGWSVNKQGNWWHGGSLPGLSSILVRTADGHCWAACANARTEGISLALDRLMWTLVRS
jgi:CubicO group peptidase (beta-lactamase class C family)